MSNNGSVLEEKRLESEIKSAIMDYLKTLPNAFFWSNHTTGIPNGMGGYRKNYQKGIADITGHIYCRKKGCVVPIALEVKREGEEAKPHQREWLGRFAKSGGYAYIVSSVKDVVEAFREDIF